MIRKTLLSLLVILTALSAWVWTESVRNERVVWHLKDHVAGGSIVVWVEDGRIRLTHWWFFDELMTAIKSTKEVLGFGYLVERLNPYQARTVQAHRIWFPIFFPALCFGSYPLYTFVSGVVRWCVRRRRFRCQGCGYSLIGWTQPRCPECGGDVTLGTSASASDYVEPVARSRVRHWIVMSLILTITTAGALIAFSQFRAARNGITRSAAP